MARPLAHCLIPLLAACALSSAVHAQDVPRSEIRSFAGVLIPTGQQARDFSTALALGGTLATTTGSRTRTIASLAWAPTQNSFAGLHSRVHVVSWDVGMEVAASPFRSRARRAAFGGVGIGARTYEYADDSLNNPNFLAGYLSAGLEIRSTRPKLRIEARDYVSGFRRPLVGQRSMRTDFVVTIGVAYEIRD